MRHSGSCSPEPKSKQMLKLDLDLKGRTNSTVEKCHDLGLHCTPVNKQGTGRSW